MTIGSSSPGRTSEEAIGEKKRNSSRVRKVVEGEEIAEEIEDKNEPQNEEDAAEVEDEKSELQEDVVDQALAMIKEMTTSRQWRRSIERKQVIRKK